jgi:hypothetical protein
MAGKTTAASVRKKELAKAKIAQTSKMKYWIIRGIGCLRKRFSTTGCSRIDFAATRW